ncbi:hypothetical protein ABGB14_44545 [Nonomuraea sp. B10E15]
MTAVTGLAMWYGDALAVDQAIQLRHRAESIEQRFARFVEWCRSATS